MKIGKPIAIKTITMSPLDAALSGLGSGKALPVRCANGTELRQVSQRYYYAKRNKTGGFPGVTMKTAGLTLYFMKEA